VESSGVYSNNQMLRFAQHDILKRCARNSWRAPVTFIEPGRIAGVLPMLDGFVAEPAPQRMARLRVFSSYHSAFRVPSSEFRYSRLF
jgi:hypothetical protein